VEEIAPEEDHVDILGARELHDFVKGSPAVILADGISLLKPNMIVGRYQDADRVRVWGISNGGLA
jgi:hypothetical protein